MAAGQPRYGLAVLLVYDHDDRLGNRELLRDVREKRVLVRQTAISMVVRSP